MRSCISVAWVISTLFTSLGLVAAQTPTTPVGSGFVQSKGGQFTLDGQPFRYIGTNAYWLQLLDKKDLNKTMHDIASLGIKVVRTWAFNDVTEVPKDGVYFQVFHSNGTISINTGENGLVRLDNIVQAAKDNKLHVLFSLTNNWFGNATGTAGGSTKTKRQTTDIEPVNREELPRNYLSNDFGGMDVYNRHFLNQTDLFHDHFYSHPQILSTFQNYVKTIVKRYANETSVLGWELANDPRCNSTIPAQNNCNTQTITKWTGTVSEVVKANDPNHLVATGDSGFYCLDCVKVNPIVPPPQTSPTPGKKRRRSFLTSADIRKRMTEKAKKRLQARQNQDKSLLHRVRGNWYAPRDGIRKRQTTNEFGSVFDGSFGVDTEDLANTPGIDFSSLQFFPDQNTFGVDGTIDITNITDVIESGVDWINLHADTANTFGQPVTITSFGLLSNQTSNTFAPFNSTETVTNSTVTTTEEQQVSAYDAWIGAAATAGANIIHYQWGQVNLTASTAGAIRPDNSTTSSPVGTINTSGVSPNDGYASYSTAVQGSLARGAALYANLTATGP